MSSSLSSFSPKAYTSIGVLTLPKNGSLLAVFYRISIMKNEKTQIFPLKNGVEYLGFRFALSDTGAVIRRVKTSSKLRYKRRLRRYQALYREGRIEAADVRQSLAGFHGHLKHGNTYWLRRRALGKFALSRGDARKDRIMRADMGKKRTIEPCIMI